MGAPQVRRQRGKTLGGGAMQHCMDHTVRASFTVCAYPAGLLTHLCSNGSLTFCPSCLM